MASRPPTPGYRPDIDGLRGVAVIAVILFHSEVPGFAGGYVGVDVFFVISGFLITSLIQTDLKNGQFSLGRFYERRIRRIMPALLLVLLLTLGVGAVLLLPADFANLGKQVLAALAFVSNVNSGAVRIIGRRNHCRFSTPGRWRSRNNSTCSSRYCWPG